MMKKDEAEDAPDVVTGTFSIHSYLVTALFDSEASHSFVAPIIIVYHFDLADFNVILGMDWLSKYHAQIDCLK